MLAVRLFDRREVELPDVGPLLMEDAETGEQLYVDTHDKGVPAAVPRGGGPARGRRCATRSGGPASTRSRLSTDEDLVGAIVRMAARRKRRRA